MKIGDRVQINEPEATYHGKLATITAIDKTNANPFQAHIDGDDYFVKFWYIENELLPAGSKQTTRPDFDKGFGIGGLGRYVEDPIIPTVAQIERHEKMEAQATFCSRCGESDAFDGAMFTTGGGNVCDDCY